MKRFSNSIIMEDLNYFLCFELENIMFKDCLDNSIKKNTILELKINERSFPKKESILKDKFEIEDKPWDFDKEE